MSDSADDELMALLTAIYRPMMRQGPGSTESTLQALELSGIDTRARFRVADLGCGTGASALVLAQTLDAEIVAVDNLEPFLAELQSRARSQGLHDRIHTVEASIDNLPFSAGEFDLIWSEGAIYNIGFEAGVRSWRRYLAPGGILVVSEITWLTAQRPEEIDDHWTGEYPEIDVASAKIRVLEHAGFTPLGYFALPERCWRENYYQPLAARLDTFRATHHSPLAQQIEEAERAEISLYEEYSQYYGYGMYIARRTGGATGDDTD